MLSKGWLKRQFEQAKLDVASLPKWMKNDS